MYQGKSVVEEESLIPHLFEQGSNLTLNNSDGDTPLQLVCQSESCVSRISSTVSPSDDLLDLVFHSEYLISHITSQVILNWLNSTKFTLVGTIVSSWKTKNGDSIFKLLCISNICFSHISSSLMLQWLNDVDTATFNILKSVHPDWTTNDGDAILHLLCRSSMKENKVVELLQYYLQQSILNPNLKDSDGNTALHLVCKADNLKCAIVSFLVSIDTKIDINDKNKEGLSPLEVTKDPKIMEKLVQNGAKVTSDVMFKIILNVKEHKASEILLLSITKKTMMWKPTDLNDDGDTALHLACKVNKPDVVKFLLTNMEWNLNIKNRTGLSPLELSKNPEIILCICQYDSVQISSRVVKRWLNGTFIDKETIMKTFELLIRKHKVKTCDGSTLLHLCCGRVNVFRDTKTLVNHLLNQHHDPNYLDKNGRTPLQITSDPLIMEKLVQHRAKVTSDVVFKIILNVEEHKASEILLLSITKKTMMWKPTDVNDDGDTALHLACKVNKPDVVKFLLTNMEWNLNIKNRTGLSPLELSKNPEIILCICQYDSVQISSRVVKRWLNGTFIDKETIMKTFDLLIRNHKQATCDGSTLLHLCCGSVDDVFRDTKTLVNHLLNQHHDPNYLDKNGRRPLQITSDPLIMEKLVQHRAKVTSDVVFKIILNVEEHKASEILLLSITKKTMMWKPTDVNDDGDTALHLACKVNKPDVVKFLLTNMKWNLNVRNYSGLTPLKMTNNPVTTLGEHKICDDSALHVFLHHYIKTTLGYSSPKYNKYRVPKYSSKNGKTPLQLTSNAQIMEMLVQHGAKLTSDVVFKIILNVEEHKASEILLLSITKKTMMWKPTDVNDDGDTALHLACKVDKPDVVKCLLTNMEWNLNIKNRTGLSPLELSKNPEIILCICQYDSVQISSSVVERWLNGTFIDKETIMKTFDLLIRNHKQATCDGSTLLHLCCGRVNVYRDTTTLVNHLLNQHHDPNFLDKNGQTPLQLTSNPQIMETLVQHGAKVTLDVVFKIILNVEEHKASEILLLSITKKTMLWKPTDLNDDGDTALHLACKVDKPNVVKILLLLTKKKTMLWEPNGLLNDDGDTALHLACKVDKPAVAKYLLKHRHCNAMERNLRNELPIELTTNIDTISLLIEHGATIPPELVLKLIATESIPNDQLAQLMWNQNIANSDGNTALHLACQANKPEKVRFLLSQALYDPNVKNNNEEVPLQMTSNSDIIKDLIRYGAQTSIMYKSHRSALGTNEPIKPPVKMFIVGNPSVGKSTLTAALKKTLNFVARLFTSGKVSGVEKKTVGIIPHEIESDIFGRVTVYDFAGHREFYSGHAAILKAAIQSTPPVFLLVVNLLDVDNEIIQNILYWISFLENQCTLVSCKPHLIIVGSHADTLKSKGVSPQEKVNTLVSLLGPNYFINLEFIGFIPMDCQRHESTGMNDLRPLLVRSCSQLRIEEPIAFNAHCFLVYLLETFKETPAVTISTIHEQIEKQLLSHREGVLDFLPKSIGALYKICVELNERGHILLLRDKKNLENSYVVIEEKSLLSEVSGTVFASEDFKQYQHLASNTGVVSLSKLAKCFPGKDINILIGFLTHLEFCHEISDQALFQLISEKYSPDFDEQYYLFPGLISLKAKESIWEAKCNFKYHFGWILQCTKLEQFFSSRFLQVLLLRLAFLFALESSSEDTDNLGIYLNCSLWKNGIFWGTHFGINMLVEINDNKYVIVMSRFNASNLLKCLKHRSQVLHTVLECVEEFCPRIATVESFIEASSALEYPFELNYERTLCNVKDLSEALISNCKNPSVVLPESGKSVTAQSLFSFEPYAEIDVSTLQELWNKTNDNKLIPNAFLSRLVKNISNNIELLIKIFNESAHVPPGCSRNILYQEIVNWRDKSETELRTYKDLREKLNKHSVFAGRNILVGMLILFCFRLYCFNVSLQ